MVRPPNRGHHYLRERAYEALCTWLKRRQDVVAVEWVRVAADEVEFRRQVDRQDSLTLDEKAREKFLECCRLLNTVTMTPVEFPKVVQDDFAFRLWRSLDPLV
jgi:hypothetical protein